MIDHLTTAQLAARWGLRPSTIKFYRSSGYGPDYITLPRRCLPLGSPRVMYPLASILAFEATHNITPLP
jgi:hypothetical protein